MRATPPERRCTASSSARSRRSRAWDARVGTSRPATKHRSRARARHGSPVLGRGPPRRDQREAGRAGWARRSASTPRTPCSSRQPAAAIRYSASRVSIWPSRVPPSMYSRRCREFGSLAEDPYLEFCEDWMLADEVTHVKMGSDWLRRITEDRSRSGARRRSSSRASSTSCSATAEPGATPTNPRSGWRGGPWAPPASRTRRSTRSPRCHGRRCTSGSRPSRPLARRWRSNSLAHRPAFDRGCACGRHRHPPGVPLRVLRRVGDRRRRRRPA